MEPEVLLILKIIGIIVAVDILSGLFAAGMQFLENHIKMPWEK